MDDKVLRRALEDAVAYLQAAEDRPVGAQVRVSVKASLRRAGFGAGALEALP